MIMLMKELFKVVERLHHLELYDDLNLFAELHLPGEPSKMFMDCDDDELDEDQRGYLLYCLANASAELNHFPQAIRHYEMTIRYLGNIRQRKLQNRYEHELNVAEIRFKMYKLYMKNRQEEEALRCLESVPRAELTPKVLFAMARLSHQLTKTPSQSTRSLFNKRVDAPSSRVINYFKAIVKDVPEAIYCRSHLISVGTLKGPSALQSSPSGANIRNPGTASAAADEQQQLAEQIGPIQTPQMHIWADVKHLQAQKCYLDAAKLLDASPNGTNLRFLLDQARFYRIAGDQQKALACYQQAHLLDSTNAEGMDAFAALLGTHNNSPQTQRELDSLAHKMLHSNPRRAESFVVYGWAQRQSHRVSEAKQFAQRAEQLAQIRGKLRCEALLLKAQLLFDTKRNYKEMEMVLADALYNDCVNTAVYALYIQMFIANKRFADAQRMAKTSMKFVGENNHQIRFLYAQALADDPTGGGQSGMEQAILVLERMAHEGNFLSLDPLLLLSRLYDRQQKYEKAISLLNRFKESYGDPRIHRELGDLLSKTNRPGEALGEYGQAMGSNGQDSATKERMINLMGGFTTPQCAVNAAFENTSTGNGAVAGAGVVVRNSTGPPAANDPRGSIMRMPPPVARVTRRTAINQHEQLRRLRGLGTMSATGSASSSSATRRHLRGISRVVAGSSSSTGTNSSGLMMVSGLSPVLAPLHFDDDQHDNSAATGDSIDTSDEGSDSSQLSLDEMSQRRQADGTNGSSSGGGNVQPQRQRHNDSSSSISALEQSRASNGQGNVGGAGTTDGGDQQSVIMRHMVRDIQRYLAASRATPGTLGGGNYPIQLTSSSLQQQQSPALQSRHATAATTMHMATRTTTTTVQQGQSLGGAQTTAGRTINDETDFVPLVADEPLLEGEVGDPDEDESRMSIDDNDNIGGPELLGLTDDEDEQEMS